MRFSEKYIETLSTSQCTAFQTASSPNVTDTVTLVQDGTKLNCLYRSALMFQSFVGHCVIDCFFFGALIKYNINRTR